MAEVRRVIESSDISIFNFFPGRLYLDKKIRSMSLAKCSRVTLLLAEGKEVSDYPVSHLRNTVIQSVVTQFVFLVDSISQISPGLEQHFKSVIVDSTTSRRAFVVPQFRWIEPSQVGELKQTIVLITCITGSAGQYQRTTHRTDFPRGTSSRATDIF